MANVTKRKRNQVVILKRWGNYLSQSVGYNKAKRYYYIKSGTTEITVERNEVDDLLEKLMRLKNRVRRERL